MKLHPCFPLSFLVFAALAGGCSKDNSKPADEGLVGIWKLVDRQCYCSPAPTPNESLIFTATNFSFFANGQPRYSGTYAPAAVTVCGISGAAPGLRLSSNRPIIGLSEMQYTLTGNQLVLDYGGPCDAPRDTYERVQ